MIRVTELLCVLILWVAPVLLMTGMGPVSIQAQDSAGPAAPVGMVRIPAGEFTMGREGSEDHSPAHRVRLKAFYLDKYEVSNRDYLKFCEADKHHLPDFWGMKEFHSGTEFPDHPVVGISWQDAMAYARWAGKRLPTEAEWEYAARGGLQGKNFPPGDEMTPAQANFAVQGRKGGTMPVGSYPANGYGLNDMSGNVVEWIADLYQADYYQSSPVENPTGPSKGRFHVIRGGGWHSGLSCNRVFYRNALPSNWVDINVGFRCAKDIDKPPSP
jgi:iron(II)-dependent oxidoreductase